MGWEGGKKATICELTRFMTQRFFNIAQRKEGIFANTPPFCYKSDVNLICTFLIPPNDIVCAMKFRHVLKSNVSTKVSSL